PEILQKTSASYEADFDRRLQRAINLLEPVLILAMGLIVGFIVIAVLLPIFELNQILN
ncbi:type II secretion system F family protein, partial [bacterium]|nr:type II secretion system F family protein [bacterium]